jgi:competence protein ComEA
MEPMAPDWRAIGGQPGQPGQPSGQPAAGRSVAALSPRQLVWLGGMFVVALVVGAMTTLLVMPAPGGVLVAAHDDRPADLAADAHDATAVERLGPGALTQPALLVVDVEGAVARPGLVRVPTGSRVADALDLAGGFGPGVDLAAAAAVLNLAQEITDGLKIVVPAIGDAPMVGATGAGSGASSSSGGPVDLNGASEAELDGLPGVGPATIAKILAARAEAPFRSVDELRLRGIVGEATLAKLRDLVTVGR